MKIAFFLAFILFPFSVICAEPVKVGDTEITFTPPNDFKPLSKEMMAAKWPSNNAPSYAVGNASGATNIAYDIKNHNIPQEALPQAQKSFAQLFERLIPGLVWKKNEIIEHSGQKWLVMEMTSTAADSDIYNIMMLTGYKGKMLVFNFNSTKKEFPVYEAQLRESMKTITLP